MSNRGCEGGIVRRAIRPVVLGIALLVTGIGPARADPVKQTVKFCVGLEQVLSASRERFEPVRGESKDGRGREWRATLRMPTSRDCIVHLGTPPAYSCELYDGDTQADADAAYRRTVELVRGCVPKAWTLREQVDGTLRSTSGGGGSQPTVRVVSELARGDAYLVTLWVTPPTQ